MHTVKLSFVENGYLLQVMNKVEIQKHSALIKYQHTIYSPSSEYIRLYVNLMPLDGFYQPCTDKQGQNLDHQNNNSYCLYQALVLLDPTRDSPQTTSQEDHTLSSKLIQLLRPDTALRI